MRKLLLLQLLLLAGCGTVAVNPVVQKKIPPKEKKTERKLFSASLSGVPAKYALKAFCLDRNLVCDLSQLPENSFKVSVDFKGNRKQFLELVEKKTGIRHRKVGDTYVFYVPEKISVKAVDLPLGKFLEIVSQQLKYSIILGEGVDLKAPVTVLAEDQPAERVLKQAFSSLGYDVSVDDTAKVINVVGWISKTIPLPSFFSNFKTADLSVSASVYGSAGSGSNTSSSMRMDFLQRLKSDFESTVRSILQSSAKAKFSINYDLGELYVEGRAEDVRRVENYVNSISEKLSEQILIDIAVVEQRTDNSVTAGVDWSTIFRSVGNHKVKVSQSSAGATTGVLSIEVSGSDFNSLIKAIQKTGKAKIVTNFRLSVPNYDVGILSSSVTRQYITQIKRDVNPITGREVWSTTTQQVSEGSALFVRPIVRSDGRVDVVIAPTISSILGVDTQQFGDITLQNPVVAQRNSPLRLIVKPDSTYVVGGIVTSTTSSSRDGVPYLSTLPLFGSAFGKTEKENRSSIIYIVVRTHISRENQDGKS